VSLLYHTSRIFATLKGALRELLFFTIYTPLSETILSLSRAILTSAASQTLITGKEIYERIF
jgi:hypothetical protein